MHQRDRKPQRVDCPSAQPTADSARIYGVVTGAPEAPRVAYLTETRPVTPELLALVTPARPTQVYRTAAPCMNSACRHFSGDTCTLAERIVRHMPPVVDALPFCRIRRTCRWFHQEGKAACLRCPQVVTERGDASELDLLIAGEAL